MGFVRGGAQRYELDSALGSSLTTRDQSGALTGLTEYDGYGKEVYRDVNTDRGDFRFAGAKGYMNDDATGWQQLGARLYIPAIGRFLTPDPIGQAGGLNLYAYCENSPLGRTDASGEDWTVGGFEFSGASVGKGLGISGAAFLHNLSFGFWDGGAYRNEAGFAESSASWTVASLAIGGAEYLGYRGILSLQGPVAGHILERHIYRPVGALATRLAAQPWISGSTSFFSSAVANIAVRRAIAANEAKIATWLASGAHQGLAIFWDSPVAVGYGYKQGVSGLQSARGVRAILRSDGQGGFGVLTAHPNF